METTKEELQAETRAWLSSRLKALRGEKGMTQARLSEASGVSVGHLRAMEAGRAGSTLSTMAKVAKGFGVQLGELMKGLC